MGITRALYEYIKADFPELHYGVAFGTAAPYSVMKKFGSDPEEPATLCDDDGGELRLQFDYVATNGAGGAEDGLEPLKQFVSEIIGQITYSGETYTIWQNVTNGVRSLGGDKNTQWLAFFETIIRYDKE